jgi:hypothetical protein
VIQSLTRRKLSKISAIGHASHMWTTFFKRFAADSVRNAALDGQEAVPGLGR